MRLPFIFTALAVTTCSADVTWIGGENGSWNEASNWDGGKVPEKCVVVFTNSASVTWSSQSDGERMIRGFVVSGGDVVVAPRQSLSAGHGRCSGFLERDRHR